MGRGATRVPAGEDGRRNPVVSVCRDDCDRVSRKLIECFNGGGHGHCTQRKKEMARYIGRYKFACLIAPEVLTGLLARLAEALAEETTPATIH
jgi:hypothetical protein